jgi:hypothetical protein
MDDKLSANHPTYNEHVGPLKKSETDEANDSATMDRRQATALNIIVNPLMVRFK